MYRPDGTYYGVVLGYGKSMTFNNDIIEIASGVHTGSMPEEVKTYKINWQEYDLLYSTPKTIDCIPLTEITTGKMQCFWFKYFEDNNFVLFGYIDFDGKLQTTELHKKE